MITPVAFVYVGSASGKWHSAVWTLVVIPTVLVADFIYSSVVKRGHGPAGIQVPTGIQVENRVRRRIAGYTRSELEDSSPAQSAKSSRAQSRDR
jgi:hypothetical protein